MTVAELIAELQKLPAKADIRLEGLDRVGFPLKAIHVYAPESGELAMVYLAYWPQR